MWETRSAALGEYPRIMREQSRREGSIRNIWTRGRTKGQMLSYYAQNILVRVLKCPACFIDRGAGQTAKIPLEQ